MYILISDGWLSVEFSELTIWLNLAWVTWDKLIHLAMIKPKFCPKIREIHIIFVFHNWVDPGFNFTPLLKQIADIPQFLAQSLHRRWSATVKIFLQGSKLKHCSKKQYKYLLFTQFWKYIYHKNCTTDISRPVTELSYCSNLHICHTVIS